MPYVWNDPECLLEYKGISIYYTYRNDYMEEGRQTYWYTQHLDGSNQFDIRDFDCFDESLFHEEIFRRAIDSDELEKEDD